MNLLQDEKKGILPIGGGDPSVRFEPLRTAKRLMSPLASLVPRNENEMDAFLPSTSENLCR